MRHLVFGLLLAATFATLVTLPLQAEENLTESYRLVAGQILGTALTDEEGWEKLEYLTTIIGHRLSGSKGLEEAIDWAYSRMQKEGLDGVTKQPVKVPHWVRGKESAQVLEPIARELRMTGLGRSVGTGPGGITAPVLVIESFEEMESLGREAVDGKIVVYVYDWAGYGEAWQFRVHGASRAAALGGVAVLVRSATGRSIAMPHTGAMRYDEGQPKIPAAAITVEDAEWLRRLTAMGHEPVVHLEMGAHTLPDADSFNVMAEIRGSEKPEEIVVMGGHYDSWDVGQGAHDDGVGCMAAWQAVRLLQKLELTPRRTLRVVLWTNEENGMAGGKAYRELLGGDVGRHVAAIEMDGGAERPIGFGFGMKGLEPDYDDPIYESALDKLAQISRLLEGIDAGELIRGGGGVDISPLVDDGVPGLGLRTAGEHYFDWHHSEGDTLDKVDPQEFRKTIAMLAVMGYVLADMPGRLAAPDWQEALSPPASTR